MAGISSKAFQSSSPDCGCPSNKKGYNGNEIQNKEFSDGSGLELYDFNARTYDQQIGRFLQIDPIPDEGEQESLNPYHFAGNNPILYNDPDGECPWCVVWLIYEVGSAVYDGYQAYKTVKDNNASGAEKTAAVGGVILSAILPGGGYGTAAKATVKTVDKIVDAGMAVDKTVDATKAADKVNDGKKTYQTYTKDPIDPKDGVYSGKTSGKGTPEQNIAKRDKNHHKNDTHGPAKLDKSSPNKNAIRGREQQNIKKNGRAKSEGGTSGNAINGVSPKNKNAKKYEQAAKKEF